MCVEKSLETSESRSSGEGERLVRITAPVLSGHGDVFAEGIRSALLDRNAHHQTKLVWSLDQFDRGGAETGGKPDGRRFGHGETLFGLAVQSKCQNIAVGTAREHLRVGVI